MGGLEMLMIKMGIGRVIGVIRGKMRRKVGLVGLVWLCNVGALDCRLERDRDCIADLIYDFIDIHDTLWAHR
jgi:hypothetical protein